MEIFVITDDLLERRVHQDYAYLRWHSLALVEEVHWDFDLAIRQFELMWMEDIFYPTCGGIPLGA